ncbi:uncharacterized protein LOC110032224 [Phalaenopsis equestris]|uniref:uncharacterized protein LOC110032224 n=1 Tax=Phalaenopsis equestris TaxID=78828 RepID=UPI0009E658C8|nr:uncharacterized protein LOC110032224 [Phalaenopsis equestris]
MEPSMGRGTKASARARSTGVSEMKVLEDRAIVISDSESVEGAEKKKPRKQSSAGAEAEKPSVGGEARDEDVEDYMDNITTTEWFDRMEEYLPKIINRVAERIIAKLRDKACLFDEYIVQTSTSIYEQR